MPPAVISTSSDTKRIQRGYKTPTAWRPKMRCTSELPKESSTKAFASGTLFRLLNTCPSFCHFPYNPTILIPSASQPSGASVHHVSQIPVESTNKFVANHTLWIYPTIVQFSASKIKHTVPSRRAVPQGPIKSIRKFLFCLIVSGSSTKP